MASYHGLRVTAYPSFSWKIGGISVFSGEADDEWCIFESSVLGTSDPRGIRGGRRGVLKTWHEAHVADTLIGNYVSATTKVLASREFADGKR